MLCNWCNKPLDPAVAVESRHPDCNERAHAKTRECRQREREEAKTDTMTVRERFAMAAMQGLLACPEASHPDEGEDIHEFYGRISVKYADALIAELAKPRPS